VPSIFPTGRRHVFVLETSWATSAAMARPNPVAPISSSHLARQSDRAADLVLDPGHGRLIGPHVRARNVFREIADGGGEGAHGPLIVLMRHRRGPMRVPPMVAGPAAVFVDHDDGF
jgi:hypothetical protein